MTFRYVKSVCQSWFGTVVLSRNSSAALMSRLAGASGAGGQASVDRKIVRRSGCWGASTALMPDRET